jgi:hypothetical protein
MSITRGGSPIFEGEIPPLPFVHGDTSGSKTVHVGVPDYVDFLAIFENNSVDICVPPSRRSSSINWGDLFSIPSDYEIKIAITSPETKSTPLDLTFKWTQDRNTAEIVCKPSQ